MPEVNDYILVNKNNLARVICVIEQITKHFADNKKMQITGSVMLNKIKQKVQEEGHIIIPMDDRYFAFFDKVDRLTKTDMTCAVCKDHFRCTAMNRR